MAIKEDGVPKAPPLFALLYCAQLHENRALPRRLVGDVPIGWRGGMTNAYKDVGCRLDRAEIECFMAEKLLDTLQAI